LREPAEAEMQERDRPRFVAGLSQLAATFRTEPTEPMYEGYWRGLRDIDAEWFEAAIDMAVMKCEFMPPVTDLRKYASKAKAKAEGRIQVGMGEWVADPWKQKPRAQLPGNVAKRMAPPVPTYAECIASCQQNIDEAIGVARDADESSEGRAKRREALSAMKHWREMRVWYEKQVAAGRGGEQISLGAFAPPPAQTPSQQPPVAPEQHWSEGREVGADDLEEAPF